MAHLNLNIYIQPARVEAFVNIKERNGSYLRMVAMVDTGAPISLLPRFLMDTLEIRPTQAQPITIEQAGIAQQAFQATEAYVNLFLEDLQGHQSPELEAKVWFAETDARILGFEGILDRAILYVDMLKTRTAWIDFEL